MQLHIIIDPKCLNDTDLIVIDKTTCEKITNRFMGTGFNKYQFTWLILEDLGRGHKAIKFAYTNKYKTKDSQHIMLSIDNQKDLTFLLENVCEGNYMTNISDNKYNEVHDYLSKHSEFDIFFDHYER